MLEAPRGLSHPQTSFIGTVCQGIHHTPFRAAHAPKNPNDSFKRQTTNHHTVKNDHKTIDLETRLQKKKPGEIAIKQAGQQSCIARVHYPVLKPPRAPTGPDPRPARPTASRQGHPENRTHPKRMRVAVREPKSIPIPLPARPPRTREANDLFHTSTPTPTRRRSPAHGPHDGRQTGVLKNSVERR